VLWPHFSRLIRGQIESISLGADHSSFSRNYGRRVAIKPSLSKRVQYEQCLRRNERLHRVIPCKLP
jgi:hypothetical protein